ncbi:2-C-methyl-D-erythritol 4-phosphate cytidylyltransferase [Microbacterium sp.]|uniref:2-C-methyl-D-erythritol 4-phosphate cytidylyltransferase n=1 Tax=Microbacterium sp. TaxID=51671 RepID=UPI0039E41889
MSVVPVPRVAVVVVAAGSGTRLGAGEPKAFVGIDAHSILRHALRGVFAGPLAQVVVVAPAGREGDALTDAREAAGARRDLVAVVAGGASRQESVAAGLVAVWPDVEIVLVHDAARALTPPEVFDRVVAAVASGQDAVLPVLPMVDTVKRVRGRSVLAAVDRDELAVAQTPQGFRRDILESAYRTARTAFTDDAALVQAAGHEVFTVPGDALSFKITAPADLDRARTAALPIPGVRASLAPVTLSARVGVGTDVHAFGGDGVLWLAGLEWPGEQALSGHSDGDAVAHAIVDALLTAAGLGDIGTHFGLDRPEFAGAHADVFLRRTAELLGEAGWRAGNVSAQVQANRPRFAARRGEAEAALSAALGAPVSVSATTTDGLGFTGAGQGVAAYAVALVVPQ